MISDLFLSGIPAETVEALIAFFSVVGASFVGGVIFAAYRAINWVEGIRAWAHSLELEVFAVVEPDLGICGRELEGRGSE